MFSAKDNRFRTNGSDVSVRLQCSLKCAAKIIKFTYAISTARTQNTITNLNNTIYLLSIDMKLTHATGITINIHSNMTKKCRYHRTQEDL